MGNNLWHAGAWTILLGVVLAACSGSSSSRNEPAEGGSPSDSNSKCTAGAARCDGLNVKVCNAEGTAESIESTCLPTQSCSEGACRETACIANSRFCKSGSVWKCDSTGGGSELAESCPRDYFCRETDGDASCSNQACTPNEPLCNGAVATTCQLDGSGPRPGGTNCEETGQACYQGECRDVGCTAGMKLCQHDDVYLCAQNGTDISLLADCRDDEVCDGATGACRAKLCDPGKPSCDGSSVATCNEYGSAWLTTNVDCAANGQVCVNGNCRDQVCQPSQSYCQDGDVYSCDSTGSVSTLSQTCNPDYYRCRQSSTYAYCTGFDCSPGQAFCDGNTIKVCTDDGGYPNTGTACKAKEFCQDATCKPLDCEAGTYFCKDDDVYYCSETGPWQSIDCQNETVCQLTKSGAICAALPCEPGSSACLGNKVGTCSTDGLTLGKVTEDCNTGSNVCGADLKCIKTATDTLGVAESALAVGSTNFIGDVVEVSSARKMTELALNLVLAGPRELRWVVYEQTDTTFTARVDKLVPNVTAAGFVSSGPFTYALKAGKRYLVGAVISGGDGVAYADSAPFTRKLSFGTLLGRYETWYQSTLESSWYTESAYQMKITTEAP